MFEVCVGYETEYPFVIADTVRVGVVRALTYAVFANDTADPLYQYISKVCMVPEKDFSAVPKAA